MSKNSHVKDKILAYLELKELTEYEFYKKSEVSRGVLKYQGGISEDNITKFLAYDRSISYGERVSLDWLLRDEGPMFEEVDPAQDLIMNEPEPPYDKKTREEGVDELLKRLDTMTQSYTYVLKEVTEKIKKLKGEE